MERTYGEYKYKTPVLPYDAVEHFEVIINIMESSDLKLASTDATFTTLFGEVKPMKKTVNNSKSVSYVYEDTLDLTDVPVVGNVSGFLKYPLSGQYDNNLDETWEIESDCDQVLVKIRVYTLISYSNR